MATNVPPGGPNYNPKDAIGTIYPSSSSTQAPPTVFDKLEFRTKIIHILSQTANGCLKELNYHPQMVQEVTELKSRIDHYRGENSKLYDDNRQLLSMVREAQNKLGAYSSTINHLEQQVAALHKANQDILTRERNLAAGNPAYNQLHSEYMHLSDYCTQLKQQIGSLQRMILEKPTSQHAPGPVYRPIAEGGQPIPVKQYAANLTQGATLKPQKRPYHVQSRSSHLSVPSQERQSQEVNSLQSVSRPSTVIRPRPLKQPNVNVLQKQESASSQPATHSNDVTRIRAPEAVCPATRIMGWVNQSSPHATEARPRVRNPSPSVASFHQGRNASAQLHSPSSLPTAGSTVTQINRNTPTSAVMRSPGVNVPPGMKFVPIGPPGKLLSPLAASVMKQPSPSSHPPSVRAPSPPRSISLPELPTPVEVVKPPPLDTNVHIADQPRTPNLTPTSSRGSVAPSEVELEAKTPLDDYVNHIVKVVKSLVNEIGVENNVMGLEEATTASSLKRSNVDMYDDDGNSSDHEESARKRLRMSEDPPSQRDKDGKTTPTNSSLQVLDEDAGDDEEEEEFGPDGKRCIGYCLAVFTEEDGDAIVCSLCRLRQESGLISAPTTFTLDTTQEAKVQHFLNEHPTAWENMIDGKNGS